MSENEIRVFFVGDRFYWKSSTIMSSLYLEASFARYDWGYAQRDLEQGKTVIIRPATPAELAWAENELVERIKRWKKLFPDSKISLGEKMKTRIELPKLKSEQWVLKKWADVWTPTPENTTEAYVEIMVQREQPVSGRTSTESVILSPRDLELIVREMKPVQVLGRLTPGKADD